MVKIVIAFSLFISCACFAQSISVGAAAKVNGGVSSSCEEVLPLLSSDGLTLYFARTGCPENRGGNYSGADIWVSRRDTKSGQWAQPSNAAELNDRWNNELVGLSTDGQSSYQIHADKNNRVRGLSVSKRVGDSWSRPDLIRLSFLQSERFLGVYVSADLEVMILSMEEGKDGQGKEDLYATYRQSNGEWSDLVNLGTTINTAGFEISPFLTADKKRLFFASNGHDGLGDADIFYSDRIGSSWDSWSAPVNLGDKVNSAKFDAYFTSYDSIGFFASNRSGQGCDLYQVRIGNPVDSANRRINELVASANSLLRDLNDDTPDSLNFDSSASEAIHFLSGSSEISREAAAQLTRVVKQVRSQANAGIVLVGGAAQNDLLQNEQTKARLEAIRSFFAQAGVTGLTTRIIDVKEGEPDIKDTITLLFPKSP